MTLPARTTAAAGSREANAGSREDDAGPAGGRGDGQASTTRGTNPIMGEIADYRRVANADQYRQTDAERDEHPSIALQQGRLSRAVDNMERATDGNGNIRPGQRDEYNAAFSEAADSSSQLIATQRAINEENRGVQTTADTRQIAVSTRNGIVISGAVSAGVAGVTGALIAWNNVREATHPASASGGTTNETNNGSNTINNNSTTNGTSNSTNNNNGPTGNTTNTTNGTTNSTTGP